MPLTAAHFRAAEAARACRTPALGAQVYQCGCGRKRLQHHSCHHRACTQCDQHKQGDWSAAQEAKLLDTGYFLITFTLPAELRPLAYSQQAWFYGIFFDAAAEALKALDLKRKVVLPEAARRSDTLGFTAVLHTWTRDMQYHPHLHVVMPGLALARDGRRIHRPVGGGSYLIPHRALARRFKILLRRKIAEHDAAEGRTDLATVRQSGWDKRWVADIQAVGNGKTAVRYLARYVHRTAVSEPRLLGETPDGRIKLNCQNSNTGQWRVQLLTPREFLRRWCLHVLPKGFTRVRHYGFLSAAAVVKRGQIRRILQMPGEQRPPRPAPQPPPECPCCKGPMKLLGTITRHGEWIPAPDLIFQLGMAILKARAAARASPPEPADTG